MTTLERIDLGRIGEQAREARPGRTVATVVAWLLVGAGFVAARLAGWLWLALAWCAVAVREGWRDGRSESWARHVTEREQRRARAGRPG